MENQHGKIAVSPGEALFISGYSKSLDAGSKSASNLIYAGRYPFPIRFLKIGDRVKKVVMVQDILEILHGQPTNQIIPPTAPRRGRPRKSDVRGFCNGGAK